MVRNRPAPIQDPGVFFTAPAALKVDESEPVLPQKAQTVGEMGTVTVKNTFLEFGTSPQELDVDANGTHTAPGKFVGRLAGATFVSGSTAPNTPAGIGRPCVAMISGTEGVPRSTRQAEVLSVSVGEPALIGPGAPPPPMHTPHVPQRSPDSAGMGKLPPSQPPQVKPMQVVLSSAIPPPAPEALAAVAALAPPAMAPQQLATTMRQPLEAGSLIEVKPLQAGSAPGALPRFAPPSYAMGYNLQTPVGANPPIAPPMFTPTCGPPPFTPSCSTPSGTKVNGLLPPTGSGYFASSIPPTPSGLAWPPTPF